MVRKAYVGYQSLIYVGDEDNIADLSPEIGGFSDVVAPNIESYGVINNKANLKQHLNTRYSINFDTAYQGEAFEDIEEYVRALETPYIVRLSGLGEDVAAGNDMKAFVFQASFDSVDYDVPTDGLITATGAANAANTVYIAGTPSGYDGGIFAGTSAQGAAVSNISAGTYDSDEQVILVVTALGAAGTDREVGVEVGSNQGATASVNSTGIYALANPKTGTGTRTITVSGTKSFSYFIIVGSPVS